jgi:hypothetical protein
MAKIAAIFQATGLNGGSHRWVEIECDPADSHFKIRGWLCRDEPEKIAIFESWGRITVLRRPNGNETRPKSTKDPSVSFEDLITPRVAWVIRPGDLTEYCKAFIEKGIPAPGMAGPFDSKGRPLNYMMNTELEFGMIRGCLLSYEAKHRGDAAMSRALLAKAVQAFQRLPIQPLLSKRDLEECFVDICAEKMQQYAMSRANAGAPRPDLLLTWEILAKLPAPCVAAEAKGLVEGYKSLIEEDRAWQEPKWFGSLSTDQKVAYWMYRLRDLDNSNDAGVVSFGRRRSPQRILNDFFLPPPEHTNPNPARELAKLGKAALPAVIAHLDDTRPTRAGHLLRYGDCCQQIFEAITGFTIFEQDGSEIYPVQMGKEKLCKQRAEKWWAEHQKDEGQKMSQLEKRQ